MLPTELSLGTRPRVRIAGIVGSASVASIPNHIVDRLKLFRRGEYLAGPEAQRIQSLIEQSRTKGSQIPEPLLFMLAVLWECAKDQARDLKAQYEESLDARAEFTAEAMGYSRPGHPFSGMPPVRANFPRS